MSSALGPRLGPGPRPSVTGSGPIASWPTITAAIAVAGYQRRGPLRIIGLFWVYAGLLEYLQHFSPGRHPAIEDFAASAFGAFAGGLAAALLVRCLWKHAYLDVV